MSSEELEFVVQGICHGMNMEVCVVERDGPVLQYVLLTLVDNWSAGAECKMQSCTTRRRAGTRPARTRARLLDGTVEGTVLLSSKNRRFIGQTS